MREWGGNNHSLRWRKKDSRISECQISTCPEHKKTREFNLHLEVESLLCENFLSFHLIVTIKPIPRLSRRKFTIKCERRNLVLHRLLQWDQNLRLRKIVAVSLWMRFGLANLHTSLHFLNYG